MCRRKKEEEFRFIEQGGLMGVATILTPIEDVEEARKRAKSYAEISGEKEGSVSIIDAFSGRKWDFRFKRENNLLKLEEVL